MFIKKFRVEGLLIPVCLMIAFGCGTTKSVVTQKLNTETKFQSIIDSIYTANPETKGIMVHIEYPDQNISWSGVSGYADFNEKTNLSINQPALLASTTKIYVAATILRLVEENLTTIETPIIDIISINSRQLLEKDGYDLASIKIKNLLSHTSGIEGYISDRNIQNHITYVLQNKQRRWTRDEQIEESIKVGDPLGKAGEVFKYEDVNYLLLTEIIEHYTQKPFYTSINELLKFSELNLDCTWFYTLDPNPNCNVLVHQYFTYLGMHSYDLDPSWDLYGGGGLASTTEEVAKFLHAYFNGLIVKDKRVQNLILHEFDIAKNSKIAGSPILNYHLGLIKSKYASYLSYGHGGLWGTNVQYFPELNCSISVFISESDESKEGKIIYEEILKLFSEM